MDKEKFEPRGIHYPIAIQVWISKDRRIRFPKLLDVPTPYVLLENTQPDHLWLGICGVDSLATLTVECSNLRVVAEYRTCSPTIPKITCERHGLLEQKPLWLITTGSRIEILPELAWQADAPEL